MNEQSKPDANNRNSTIISTIALYDIEKSETKKDKLHQVTKIPDHQSPKTIRRDTSRDNFMKFHWAWTL